MLLMQHAMDIKMSDELGCAVQSDITKQANIVCDNALTIRWEDVVIPEKLNYILGNPPFSGARMMTDSQKKALIGVFGNITGAGNLDFVTAWFAKSAFFTKQNKLIRCAFVATNSICQGEQVSILWKYLFTLGIEIDFCYQTFKWSNEAKGKAAVFCVIVGFSQSSTVKNKKILFENNTIEVKNISPYLIEGNSFFVESRNTPLCNIPEMGIGNKPIDNGNYLFTEEEKNIFISKEPLSNKYFKIWIGSRELLHGERRYCLWLGNCSDDDLQLLPECQKRVENVKLFRSKSKSSGTQKLAQYPTRFHVENMPDSDYLAIPKVSSERRSYIPMAFLDKNTLVSDLIFVQLGTLYDFGILTSAMHMAWMRTVCGRLEMRYRYSRDLCYNTFPWPTVSDSQKKEIEALADRVLMVREDSPELTLADKYDPDKMPVELREAHTALDVAVDSLYREKPFENDEERLQLLFQLYENLVSSESVQTSSDINEEEEDA